MKQSARRFLPFILAVILLAYALKGVSVNEITDQFRTANYLYIFAYSLSTLVFYAARGKRWQQPLIALGYYPTTFRSTVAIMAGNVASMIFPGAGELTRCATLLRTDRVPISQGVGSIVAERIIDILMLVGMMLITLLVEYRRMITYIRQLNVSFTGNYTSWWLVTGSVLCLVAAAVAIWLFRQPAVHQHYLFKKIKGVVIGMWQGVAVVRKLPSPGLFMATTLIVQVTAWASAYFLLLAVHTNNVLTPAAALLVLTASSVGGLAVPTQAGVGTYHFMVGNALVLYGFSLKEGVLIATFMHAVGLGVNLIFSGMSFLIIPFLSRVQKQKESGIVSEP